MEGDPRKPKWFVGKTSGNANAIPKKREAVSALTGRTMEQIAGQKSAVWGAHALSRAVSGASPEISLKAPKAIGARGRPPRHARRVRSPEFVKPMKATAVGELPEEGDWIYEIKWDGYRALGRKHDDDVRLLSLKEKTHTSD